MKIVKYTNSSKTPKKIGKDGTIAPSGVYKSSTELDPGDAAIYMFSITKN